MMRRLVLALACTAMFAATANAEDLLRVGNPSATAFSFVPVNVAMEKGIFAKNGIKIEYLSFGGDAKLQQAMIADSVDIAVASGPALAFVVKGAPELGIAATAGPPLLLVWSVRADLPIKTIKDLKGTKVAVSTAGSLTDWLPKELARQQGWGPDGITTVHTGGGPPALMAVKSKQAEGWVTGVNQAWDLEAKGEMRTIVKFGDVVRDFIMHVTYATNKIMEKNPDAVRRFNQSWFETIKFMRANRAETVKIAAPVIGSSPEVTARTYDELMPMFSDTGKFEKKALDVLARSFVELGTLDTVPDLSKTYTEKFLPQQVTQ
jgi:ABC-type nitrate/sulfonate/bicarbonate transport system substrate-binding protein